MGSLLYSLLRRGEQPPGLIAILTPANLFTGVLACGFICLLSVWSDWKHLPRGLRTGAVLTSLNFLAGILFLTLGLKGYLDHSGWKAPFILLSTLALGWVGAWVGRNFRDGKR